MRWQKLKPGKNIKVSIPSILVIFLIMGAISCVSPVEKINGLTVVESKYSDVSNNLSIGLANIHAIVPDIEANKEKMLEVIDTFKKYEVNMIIFPEFCISGYFWDDEEACWAYQESGLIENQEDWLCQLL